MNSVEQQHIDLILHDNVTEHSLLQQNEILQKEVDRAGHLIEAQNQRVQELVTALQSLNKDVDFKKCQPLQVRSQVIENEISRSNGSLENGKPKSIDLLEKGKAEAKLCNYVPEMVTLFNSKGT